MPRCAETLEALVIFAETEDCMERAFMRALRNGKAPQDCASGGGFGPPFVWPMNGFYGDNGRSRELGETVQLLRR